VHVLLQLTSSFVIWYVILFIWYVIFFIWYVMFVIWYQVDPPTFCKAVPLRISSDFQ